MSINWWGDHLNGRFWRRSVIILLLVVTFMPANAYAAKSSWHKVVDKIDTTLMQVLKTYNDGDVKGAKDQVNNAYYGPYEADQMEKAIKYNISSKRNAIIEEEFRQIRKSMTAGATNAEIKNRCLRW